MEKKPRKKPVFDFTLCMACNDCASLCPVSCIHLDLTDVDAYKKAYPRLTSMDACTSCALCAKHCPVQAVSMSMRKSA